MSTHGEDQKSYTEQGKKNPKSRMELYPEKILKNKSSFEASDKIHLAKAKRVIAYFLINFFAATPLSVFTERI